VSADAGTGRFTPAIAVDPFDHRAGGSELDVASTDADPTVPSTRGRGGRALTAILIADDRRVAVIDDSTVSVGDHLRDGARVSAIQPDRVFVVEKSGQWTVLVLANREGTRR
jgi:hypothetical protein